jgi:glucose-1-phosphate thymidylyltransferase
VSAHWGVLPAAGTGSRIQPLAFSKELLPVGSREDNGIERPRAVSEYLLERFVIAGVDRICCVIALGKSDILEYYGDAFLGVPICYVVQARPAGLCDAIFRVRPLLAPGDRVTVGLPDTIWFPRDGLRTLPADGLAFLLFPVDRPEFFDAVVTDERGRVQEIQVKQPDVRSSWIWGAFGMPGAVLESLYGLWFERAPRDEYVGSLVNEYLARGGSAVAVRAGTDYVDVGTFDGYRRATRLFERHGASGAVPGEEARP